MPSAPCVCYMSLRPFCLPVGPARMLLLQTPCPDALPDRPSLDHLGADRRTLADWVTEPALQPLVVRTRRCRIPLDLEVPPGAPRVWVLRLPSADTVRRTAQHREGLARLAHWGALARGWAAASLIRRPTSVPLPKRVGLHWFACGRTTPSALGTVGAAYPYHVCMRLGRLGVWTPGRGACAHLGTAPWAPRPLRAADAVEHLP